MIQRIVLFVAFLVTVSCTQTPIRRLPVADDMAPTPAGATAASPPANFVSFYPKAEARVSSPPELSRYGIECTERLDSIIGSGYFTLARTQEGTSTLIAFTQNPVRDLSEALSFGRPGRSLDWGFVYDRNADGWADYVVFLDGAMPVETEEIVGAIPKRSGAKAIKLSEMVPGELELMMKNTRLIFIHHVDDNFDGKADAIVGVLWDPERPVWIYRRAVLRSNAFTQEVDEEWTFVTSIIDKVGSVPKAEDQYRIEGVKGPRHLENSTKLLNAINAGIRRCRIPKGALPRE